MKQTRRIMCYRPRDTERAKDRKKRLPEFISSYVCPIHSDATSEDRTHGRYCWFAHPTSIPPYFRCAFLYSEDIKLKSSISQILLQSSEWECFHQLDALMQYLKAKVRWLSSCHFWLFSIRRQDHKMRRLQPLGCVRSTFDVGDG